MKSVSLCILIYMMFYFGNRIQFVTDFPFDLISWVLYAIAYYLIEMYGKHYNKLKW